MTFVQAIKRKNKLRNDGYDFSYRLIITPHHKDDLENYCRFTSTLSPDEIEDTIALLFSKTKCYLVQGLDEDSKERVYKTFR
jgi:hypothetical protein